MQKLLAIFSTIVLMISVAACGSGARGNSSAASGGSDIINQKQLNELFRGDYTAPPPGPRIAPGKLMQIVSCGQSISTCAAVTAGAQEAAAAAGWATTVFDTKADPGQASIGVEQALVSKADGIFVYLLDCRYEREALRKARVAGIPVVAAESVDCDFNGDGEPLFSGTVTYVQGDYPAWITAYGKVQAQYAIAESGGDARTIDFIEQGPTGAVLQQKAQREIFNACGESCSLYEVQYDGNDLATGLLQQKAEQALVQHPDANSLIVQYDGVMSAGVAAALRQSGRSLVAIAAEGGEATMTLVRSGLVSAGVGIPVAWEAWAAVDALNRIFHGERPVSSGIGIQVYNREHNTPESGAYEAPIDFRSEYKRIWGVG